MSRALLAAVLALALLATGCLGPRITLPPGDADRLTATIARKGQGEPTPPPEPEPSGSFFLADCLKSTGRVCASVALIGAWVAYSIAGGMSGTPAPSSNEGLGHAWDQIWCDP